MKWSKKQQAKWDKKNRDRMTGHSVNSEEDASWERLKKIVATFRRPSPKR